MAIHYAEDILLASAARTTTQTSATFTNPDDDGVVAGLEVVMNLTAGATLLVTLSIEEYDEATAAFISTLAGSQLTAAGISRLVISPVAPTAANVSRTAFLAKRYRVVVTHGNANSATYGVTLRRLYER